MKKVKNRKIMVIGGAGFIGHNLSLKLKKLGAKVLIVDALEKWTTIFLTKKFL